MIRSVLGSRASIGGPLGSGRGGAAAWYLAGGVSAANCVAAYQPKGAASLSASYTNLANPGTYTAAPGVAPTLTADGWTGTGTQYLTTGIVPASGWSMIVRFVSLSAEATDNAFCGSYGSGNTFFLVQPRYPVSNSRFYGNGGISTAISGRISSGVMAIAGGTGYLDGVQDYTGMAAWSGTGYGIYLMAANGSGTLNSQSPINGSVAAVAIYNATLSAAQVAEISSAMAAL